MENTLIPLISSFLLVISISVNIMLYKSQEELHKNSSILFDELESKKAELEEQKYKVDDLERKLASVNEQVESVDALMSELKEKIKKH
jgi:hypothetical protein